MKNTFKKIGYGILIITAIVFVYTQGNIKNIFAKNETLSASFIHSKSSIPGDEKHSGIIHRGAGHQFISGPLTLSDPLKVAFGTTSKDNFSAVFDKPADSSTSFFAALDNSWVGGNIFVGVKRDNASGFGFNEMLMGGDNGNPWMHNFFNPNTGADFSAAIQKVNVEGTIKSTNLVHDGAIGDSVCIDEKGSLVICTDYACLNQPANATRCDLLEPSADTESILSDVCDTSLSCQFICGIGYHYEEDTAVKKDAKDTKSGICVLNSCTGVVPAHANLCDGDNTALTGNVTNSLVGNCGAPKCEYTCADGYTLTNGECVAVSYHWVGDFGQCSSGSSAVCSGTVVSQSDTSTVHVVEPFNHELYIPGWLEDQAVNNNAASLDLANQPPHTVTLDNFNFSDALTSEYFEQNGSLVKIKSSAVTFADESYEIHVKGFANSGTNPTYVFTKGSSTDTTKNYAVDLELVPDAGLNIYAIKSLYEWNNGLVGASFVRFGVTNTGASTKNCADTLPQNQTECESQNPICEWTPAGVSVKTRTVECLNNLDEVVSNQLCIDAGAILNPDIDVNNDGIPDSQTSDGCGAITYDWACQTNSSNPGDTTFRYSSCFIADTQVTLSDGTLKNIQDVQIGDTLKGQSSDNKVLGFHQPKLGEKKLYSLNGGKYFVTAEHPFMTMEGWKAFNPELAQIEHNLDIEIGLLQIGDVLITENGNVVLETVNTKSDNAQTQLYNFVLSGDRTYYADGYLVHNKTQTNLCNTDGGYACVSGTNSCVDKTTGLLVPPASTMNGMCVVTCEYPNSEIPACVQLNGQDATGTYCDQATGYMKCLYNGASAPIQNQYVVCQGSNGIIPTIVDSGTNALVNDISLCSQPTPTVADIC